VESFSVYPTGVLAENVDPNQQKLALNQEVVSAAIVPTEVVTNMLSELRLNLIQQKQFNVAELQKVAMLYFGLASDRQVELGASDQAEDARLQQLVHMGREVVLSEVHAYFQERIHFADNILNLVEENPQENINRTNFVDTVEETLQQLRNLQTYAAGFNLPSIMEFVNSNIDAFSKRYQRLLELHTQLTTPGQASESPSTLQVTNTSEVPSPTVSAPEAPSRREIRYIPPVVSAAIKRIFKL